MQTTENSNNFLKWLVLLLAVSSYLMGFIVRFSWPPLIAVAAPELGIDMTKAGLYMSAFYIGYVATHIPAGFLADRFGVRYLLAGALLLEGLSHLGIALIGSFAPGFLLRIFAGLGAGIVYASCVRSIATWFRPNEQGVAFGLLMLSPTAGVLLANQISTIVMKYFQWKAVFVSIGGAAIALSVIVLLVMKDTGRGSKGHTFTEGLRFVVGNPNIMRMGLAGFCLMWIQIGFISWSNTAIKTAGFSLENAGFAMTLFGLGGIIGPLVSGYLADRTGSKKWLLIFGFSALIPTVLLFGYIQSLTAFTVFACVLGFIFGYINTFMPLMVLEYSGPQWAASAGGVTGCIFQTGAILGPAVLGLSIDLTGSFQAVWWLLAAGPAIGLFFLLPLEKPELSTRVA